MYDEQRIDNMNKKCVTATDVARRAGVSQSTVSMILNGREDDFTSQTVERVFQAVKELGYEHRSRGVRYNEEDYAHIIAIFSSSLLNPYYPELISSIERAAERQGFSTAIFDTRRRPELEKRYLAAAKRLNVAGIICTYMPIALEDMQNLQPAIPLVVVGDKADSVALDAVEFNSFLAGRMLAAHLAELGHKRIAFISTPLNTGNTARVRRLEGIRQDLKERGLEEGLILRLYPREANDPNDSRSSERHIGYDFAQEILQRAPDVTAFIGVNDMIAYGILDAMQAAGKQLPKDVSVCGFDNISFSTMSGVSLTTVDYFSGVKGQDALEILLRKRNKTELGAKVVFKMEVTPQIVIRSTTGPAPVRI